MIRLAEINESSFFAVRALSVAPEQRAFLDSAAGILARGYLYSDKNARVWANEKDGEPIGLALVKDMDEEPACGNSSPKRSTATLTNRSSHD